MPASPILLLVPYRNKAAVLYSQIPTSASASGDMVVSRAGVSTRVNAQGLIESVAANVPRLNYPLGGVANGCPALLVEPSATNSALRSAELDNAVWTNALWGNWSNATAASSTTIAPDGSTNAEELTFTTNTSSRLQRITGIAASTTYTFSMYVMGKAGNSYQNGILLRIATGFNNALVATSAATGRVDSTVSNTAWTRYSVTFTTPSSGVNEFNVGITVANSGTNPNATMICWGAQLELGVSPTSYIPTTTGTVTRNADIVTNNTFVIPNLIGAILTEFDSPTSGTYFLDNIPIPIASGSNKIAISYTPTTLTIYRNGAQVSGSPVTPPGGTAPVIGNVINIGHNNQLYQLGSGIKSFVLYSSTLSAAEASGLTT